MKLALTRLSIRHPWLVLILTTLLVVGLGLQMPSVQFDNDPENMLAEDAPVRVFHHEVKEKFGLYDFIVVGVVNEVHPNGVFNAKTLGQVYDLTAMLLSLHPGEGGVPQVELPEQPGRPAQTITVDMSSESLFTQALQFAFHQNPNMLFDAEGRSAVIGPEMISPSLVDSIEQAELGSLKLAFLMEQPPANDEEALAIGKSALANPLYKGTMVSEDGRAMALFLPIRAKSFSYNLANLVHRLTDDWSEQDQVYITGLPVAEDTFGVEMLIQMATSAPMAGLAVFLLMFLFFRRLSLIVAPMVVAVFSIIMTMGLLIGMGFDVHIMTSMIAIFLMPIAVADAIHILSEFHDVWPRFRNKPQAIDHVVRHLFSPMLYTSLTTIVGFASLATTPIPPVQVFGLFVAFGVAMAWVMTMTLVPAYIMIFVSEASLDKLTANTSGQAHRSLLTPFLDRLGRFSYQHAKAILVVTVLVLGVSVYGITRIRVNDNPVRWFTPSHEIRIADRVLNEHFGGTYTAYLTLASDAKAMPVDRDRLLKDAANKLPSRTAQQQRFAEIVTAHADKLADPGAFFAAVRSDSAELDGGEIERWVQLGDDLNGLDPSGITVAALERQGQALPPELALRFRDDLAGLGELQGEALLDAALAKVDAHAGESFAAYLDQAEIEASAPTFKRPEMLRYIKGLAEALVADGVVGKTTTVTDALEKAAYELRYQDPASADPAARSQIDAQNRANYAVPDSSAAIGQVFSQLEGMKKKDALFHLVTRDYQEVNLWIQLKSGDNSDMELVIEAAAAYLETHKPPIAVTTGWAGLTYINVEWQKSMVKGMMNSLLGSFVFVLLMMIVLFRSLKIGFLAMVPLTVTITSIYGLIGLVGKDYDMPIAVLSSLTLGLSVDFAIHFLERSRELYHQLGNWRDTLTQMFKEPAMAISRNAITISIGFSPLLLAPLVPYKTVGFFLATIMAVSWLATLLILAAMGVVLERFLFKTKAA